MAVKRKAKRNYKQEYIKFQSSQKAISDRQKRNTSRKRAEKSGRVKKGDGKDLHHPNGLNSKKTRVMSASKNRGIREKSRLKGSTRKKRR